MSTDLTPLDSFINHKADTGMQCGNYSIDVHELKEGEQYRFHFDATVCVGCHCCEAACNELQNNSPEVYSDEVPDGIKMKEREIAGVLEKPVDLVLLNERVEAKATTK